MKLWGIIRKNDKIQHQHTIEYPELTRDTASDWDELISPLCQKLDLSRPLMLKKHLKEIDEFSRVVFLPSDFIESVDFDRFEVEIFYPKKK